MEIYIFSLKYFSTEYLKENNENMKRQFQMLLQWKEKVRDSNKQNLLRFEQLHRQINILRVENEKYKQALSSPDKEVNMILNGWRLFTLANGKYICASKILHIM